METSTSVSHFREIHPNDLSAWAPAADFDIVRIPLNLNLSELRQLLEKSKSLFPWRRKDDMPGYSALGLQYSREEATEEEQFAEAVDATTIERPFRMYHRLNSAGRLFEGTFLRFFPTKFFRSRLLSADAGLVFPGSHNDGQYAVRLHIPITTNPAAWMEVGGRRYHLPADGSAFLVNTSRMHRIGNDGDSNRTHLVSVIYPEFPSFLHTLALSALIRVIDSPKVRFRKNLSALTEAALAQAENRCTICHEPRRLHAMPIAEGKLRAACAQCIETVGRLVSTKNHRGDLAIDEFEIEFRTAKI